MGPQFSPSSGIGTIWNDPNTGSSWQYTNSGWKQISNGIGSNIISNATGGGAGNTNTMDINSSDFWDKLTKLYNTPSTIAAPNYPAGVFDVTSPDIFIKRAMEELTPYYTQLLKEADGDVNLAKQRLEEDYKLGVRVAKEDLESNLARLGITFTQEANTMRDNLNKRGIALTQTTPGVAGRTTYAGGGQPQTELSQLTEDQRLRKEAEDRTAQRAAESAGIKKQRGTEDVTRQDQLYREELQRQKEEQAVSRAGVYSSAEQSQKSAEISKAQAEAAYPTTTQTSSNFMDYYKGWDPNVAKADYQAVYGGDIKKLQASKPL